MIGSEESLRLLRDRFTFLYIALSAVFTIVLLRMVYLQIIRGEEFHQYSEENRMRQEKVAAPRGMVYDRDGVLLVDNVPAFDVTLTPQFMQNKKETIQKLAQVVELTPEEIELRLSKTKGPSFLPRPIVKDANRDLVARVSSKRLDLPGVDVDMRIKRFAVGGEVGAQVLGYVGEISKDEIARSKDDGLAGYAQGDIIGKDGIEAFLENYLRGKDGLRFVEVDARGRRKNVTADGRSLYGVQTEIEASPGNNVTLTLDYDLQTAAYSAFGDKIGAAVAMDANTGALLVMVSKPSFDPTLLSTGVDRSYFAQLSQNEFHPFGNKGIHAHQAPGSTFKMVTALAGLEEGIITPSTSYFCGGKMRFGGRDLHCHKKHGHGRVDVHTALVKSCNIFFYNVANKLGIDRIAKYSRALGLGHLTGVELTREIPGLIPDSAWKENRFGIPWQDGETLSVGIGQGFVLVTPVQIMRAYAAIANGGRVLTPYLVKEVRSPLNGTVVRHEPPPIAHVAHIKPETIDILRKGLKGVVNEVGGTMFARRLQNVEYAGKTGTTQVKKLSAETIYEECELLPFKERRHAWFVGYGPADAPEIAVAVLAEHACHGGSGAGPVAQAILRTYIEKKRFREGKNTSPPSLSEAIKSLRPTQQAPAVQAGPTPLPRPQPVEKIRVENLTPPPDPEHVEEEETE